MVQLRIISSGDGYKQNIFWEKEKLDKWNDFFGIYWFRYSWTHKEAGKGGRYE